GRLAARVGYPSRFDRAIDQPPQLVVIVVGHPSPAAELERPQQRLGERSRGAGQVPPASSTSVRAALVLAVAGLAALDRRAALAADRARARRCLDDGHRLIVRRSAALLRAPARP